MLGLKVLTKKNMELGIQNNIVFTILHNHHGYKFILVITRGRDQKNQFEFFLTN